MSIKEIINNTNVETEINKILQELHKYGPVNQYSLERLAYIKKFVPELFVKYEKSLMYLMGLFYKTSSPTNFIDEVYSIYADAIKEETGHQYTPMQANAYRNIKSKIYFSFSSPTSSGKSFLFRDLIKETTGDIVIVVPSRALISEYVYEILEPLKLKKDVLVLQFIEIVNIKHSNRKIYVITPERGNDLFANAEFLNVELFLFDESQLSEEEIRGMRFDALVRRISRYFPDATKVFAHPFVDNPQAQLIKHGFEQHTAFENYNQSVVGKIYSYIDKNNNFFYFSPFETPLSPISTEVDIVQEVLRQHGTLLVYISKDSIYKKTYLKEFKKYIDLCSEVDNPEALKIIEDLKLYLGVTNIKSRKFSLMLKLMKKGIVIHHGSIPLKARLLIERFVNQKFAQICFATSTLTQGINMPFDVVWIENFYFNGENEELKLLEMKNLIGRAGRTSPNVNNFDFGYVVMHRKNVKRFINRLKGTTELKTYSRLDNDLENLDIDLQDTACAIQQNKFDDDLRITEEQKNRLLDGLNKGSLMEQIKYLLDTFIPDNVPLKGEEYNKLPQTERKKIKEIYKDIYITHMRRKDLSSGEIAVLSTTIPILLWRIQGKSFKEIVSIRLDFLSQYRKRKELKKLLKEKTITYEEYYAQMEDLKIQYSQGFALIPNKNVKRFPLFDTKKTIDKIDYDILIWDTYDYLDKVISWALSDPLSATFILYNQKTNDERALAMANYIKYGTNDENEIWLIKYGFDFEDIEWLIPYIDTIDENEIVFKSSISELPDFKQKLIERYVNNVV